MTTAWAPQSILRTARKARVCRGDGAGLAYRQYAEGHTAEIRAGEPYLEYCGEARPYESGTAHCMACAKAFYTNWNDEGSIA